MSANSKRSIQPNGITACFIREMSIPSRWTPIDVGKFQALLHARDGLMCVLDRELIYECMVGNYSELEEKLLSSTVELALRNFSLDLFDQVQAKLNRILSNFLSSARAWRDQAKRGLAKSDQKSFDAAIDHLRKTSLPSRAILQLRNHAQHFGLPAHVLSFQSRWREADGRPQVKMEQALFVGLDPSQLRKDRDFADHDIDALVKVYGAPIPTMPLVREFMQAVSAIHMDLRSKTADDVRSFAKVFKDNAELIAGSAEPSKRELLVAVALDDKNAKIDEVYLGARLEDLLFELQRRNGLLHNLPARIFQSQGQ